MSNQDIYILSHLGRRWRAIVKQIERETPKTFVLKGGEVIKKSNLDGVDFIGQYQTLEIDTFERVVQKELEACQTEERRLKEILLGIEAVKND